MNLLCVAEKKKEENFQGKKNHTIVDPIEDDKTGIDEVMGMSTATESCERGRWNYELIKPLLLPRSFTETTVEAEEERTDRDEDHNRMTLPTVSNYTIDDTVQVDKKTTPEQPGMSWTSDLSTT